MVMLRKHAAQLKAQDILKKANQLRPPINLPAVSVFLGIHVEEKDLEDSLSGLSFIDSDKRFVVINSNHAPNRKRFTWAHEIAHHVMHVPMLRGGVHVDKRILRRDELAASGTNLIEIEANNFAAELLMPTQWIEQLAGPNFDLGDDEAIEELAQTFQVSSAALYYRILRGTTKSSRR